MAYAAVISLKHNIKQLTDTNVIDSHITKIAFDKFKYLEGLLQALDIKSNKSYDMGAIKALDAEIRKAVWKVEDALESYAFCYESLPPSDDNGCPQMQMQMQIGNNGVEQEIHSFIQTVEILGSKFNTLLDHPLDGEEGEGEDDGAIPDYGGNKSTAIGLSEEDRFENINWDLVDGKPGIKTVLLVGMAGIGKTHFATEIYQHPRIVKYFDLRAWVKVGRKRGVKDILVDIVAQIERKPRNIYVNKNMYTLGALLREKLDGERCLIVLDDIWSEPVCHEIIGRLGEAGVRRVLLTSRLGHIGGGYKQSIHQMRFLDNEESWDLLWKNVFTDENSFPPRLEKAGRKIAANCEGLPLLILVVAKLLRGADNTQEYWNKVADKKTTTFVDAYEQISKVLMSSYEYLPEHLKACFLYMGVFPQSSEIPLSKLINLLSVEDFLEPNYESDDQTLEDFGIECVKKLISNSLVIICKQSYNSTIKSCKLHSVYWYVCVKEARKNKFFQVLNKLTDGAQECIESQRRLSVQNSILFSIKEVHESMAGASTARSLLCTGKYHEYPVPIRLNLMLLRVLDALSIHLYEFPEEVVKLLLLRYLALTHNGKLPCSISNLRRLQFLIISQHHNIIKLVTSDPRDSTFVPEEVWDMQQLKHLRMMGHNLPDPSNFDSKLPNLETLYVNAHSCTEAVFRSLPNLKKLGITIELQPDDEAAVTAASSCFEHIGLLSELESLKCVVANPSLLRNRAAPPPHPHPHHLSNLPRGLRKLSFKGLGYSWEEMSAISSFSNLEVLKLRSSACRGSLWMVQFEDFRRLEFLLLEDIDLEYLHALYNSMPNLYRLTVRHCYKLREIDCTIGMYNVLTVELVDCVPSVVASAKKMLNQRHDKLTLKLISSGPFDP